MTTKSKSKKSKPAKAAKPEPKPKTKAPKKFDPAVVVSMRDNGASWSDIADKVGVDSGTARWAYLCATVKSSDRIKGTDEEIAVQIVTLRDEQHLAWPVIAARAGRSQATIKRIYEDQTGSSANQGFSAVSARAAANAAEKGEAAPRKAKTGKKSTTNATNKARKAKVTKSRKKAKGSANPSKG